MAETTSTVRTPNPRGSGERLRQELVEAAGALLVTTRDESPFSLRAVAKTVGVSPAAVYRHFDSAAELVEAVLADRADALRDAIGPTGGTSADVPSFVELGRRYVRWGLGNPGAYALLFESADRIGHAGGPGAPGWDMIETFAGLLTARSGLDERDAEVLAIRAWTSLHGVTSLRLHKPAVDWPTTVEEEVAAIGAALFGGAADVTVEP